MHQLPSSIQLCYIHLLYIGLNKTQLIIITMAVLSALTLFALSYLAPFATAIEFSTLPGLSLCKDGSSVTDGWITDPKDARTFLNNLRGDPKPSVFLEANETTTALHGEFFAALAAEDYSTAFEKADSIGYDYCLMRQMKGEYEDQMLVFSSTQDQQIHLLYRAGPTDPIYIQSGHTFKDQSNGGSGEIATLGFVKTNARLYLRNSIAATKAPEDSPCSGDYKVSDGPHYDKGWFHMAHKQALSAWPHMGIVQFHGMTRNKDDGRTCHIHISPGFKDVVKEDSFLRWFDNGLLATFEGDYVDDFMASSAKPSAWTNLLNKDYHPATFNVQGRDVNQSPDVCKKIAKPENYNAPTCIQQFVHLELSGDPRSNHVDELCNAIDFAAAHWRAQTGEGALIEAEDYAEKNGDVKPETKGNGVTNLGFIDTGNWVKYNSLDLGNGSTTFRAQISSKTDTSSGSIAVHIDSLDNEPVAVLENQTVAGGWSQFALRSVLLNNPVSGMHDVYLKFKSGYNVDWFTFA